MDIKDAIMGIAEAEGVTFSSLSTAMGRNHTYISSNLGRGRCPLFDNVLEMASALGYSVCLIKSGDEPDGACVVDEYLTLKKLSANKREARLKRERERRRRELLAELEKLDSE